MPVHWKERLAWITAAALTSILAHWQGLSRAFGLDLEGVMGGRFQAAFAKAWDRGGFLALEGRPFLTPIPTEVISGELYAHHPPLYHWISYLFYQLFGPSEFSLRLYPALASALLAAALVDWVRGRMGRSAAVVALIAFVSAAMTRVYGSMANYEAPLILFAFLAYRMIPEGELSRRRGLLVAGLMFLAVGHDWPALFFVPAIFMALVIEGRRWWRPMLWLGLGAGTAILAYLLLLIFWKGGFEHSSATLQSAFISGRESRPFELSELLRQQYQHLRLGYGYFVFLALGYGLYAACSKAAKVDRRNARLGLVWCLSGLCYLLAFPSRALDHEFCWFYPVPGIILLMAVLIQDLSRRAATPRAKLGIYAALMVILILSAQEAFRARPDKSMPQNFLDLIEAVNDVMGADTMVLTPRIYAGAWFYFDPWMVENVRNPQVVQSSMEYFEGGALTVNRLVIEMMPPLDAEIPKSFLSEHQGQELRFPGVRLWVFDR